MEQQSLYRYYSFGYNYCVLRMQKVSGMEKAAILSQVNSFLDSLREFDLQVTQKISADLVVIKAEIEASDKKEVSAEHASRIEATIEKLDPALDAELKLRAAYIMTKKRHALQSLTESPQDLLGKDSWKTLTETSEKDFRSACMLIALSQPTGAAFHLMRALEEQVKVLYFAFKKTKRLAKPMWGPMTAELRKKNKPKPSEKLLSHLDGMRVHFRNPTQHPTAFYSMNDAEDLLSQTTVAIGMICAELPPKAV